VALFKTCRHWLLVSDWDDLLFISPHILGYFCNWLDIQEETVLGILLLLHLHILIIRSGMIFWLKRISQSVKLEKREFVVLRYSNTRQRTVQVVLDMYDCGFPQAMKEQIQNSNRASTVEGRII
jgi:hypothetical protein